MLLVIFLSNLFKLYYCKDLVLSDSILIDDIIYIKDDNSKSNQGLIVFFDWLRTCKNTIAGIRVSFFDDLPYTTYLQRLPYVIPSFRNKCAEIMFNEDRYDPELSGDQDFTNNYAFVSASGNYLFTFGLDHLNDEELRSLQKYCSIIEN